MSTEGTPRAKYVLECIGLLITMLATIIGLYVSLRQPDAASPTSAFPVVSPEDSHVVASAQTSDGDEAVINKDSSQLELPTAKLRAGHGTAASLVGHQVKAQLEQQRSWGKIEGQIGDYFSFVTDVEAQFVRYDATAEAAYVSITLGIDVHRYDVYLNKLLPAIAEDYKRYLVVSGQAARQPRVMFDLSIGGDRGDAFFEFTSTASEEAQTCLQSILKLKRTDPRLPQLLVTIQGDQVDGRGKQLAASCQPVSPQVGKAFEDMFQRAADAKFRLRLLSNSKEVIAVCSQPLAAPHTGSWDPQRFVIPAAPLADRASLQRQRLSPAAAMGTVHRKTNESFRLFGLFPAFLTPEVRHTSKESSGERARFTQEVVYHLQIPLRSSLAAQVTEVNAQLFE